MTPCTPFTGTISKRTGYGVISRGGTDGVCGYPAHRYYYEQTHGKLPKGMVVMHLCDNPSCVNVAHLKAGTQSENMLDCSNKGRMIKLTGEKNHQAKLKEVDVIWIKANLHLENKQLGLMFGVSRRTISDIRTGKTWRNI